ncbi:MAG TPA: hypothetical protein VGL34_12315 [Steroidobacteraceae bacterium]|jgi:hypothetical protein
MSDSKTPIRYTGIDRRTPRVEPGAVKPGAGSAAPREGYKTGGRHAAITNNLYNWHSYKNWADKVRGSWEDKK